MNTRAMINPFYAARNSTRRQRPAESCVEKVTIGNATLYRADCFNILAQLSGIGAAITDPPYCIGFKYRSYDDAPHKYDALMTRLIPELVRVTGNGPCFVWQSPLRLINGTSTFRPATASWRHASAIRSCLDGAPA